MVEEEEEEEEEIVFLMALWMGLTYSLLGRVTRMISQRSPSLCLCTRKRKS
jgi:hypothetical protein